MAAPSFWTPIKYENIPGHSFYNFVEAYFNWSGREVAHVIPQTNGCVVLSGESPTWMATIAKIAFTLATFVVARKGYERCAPKFHPAFLAIGMVPLLLLISKIYFRLSHKFHLVDVKNVLDRDFPTIEELNEKITAHLERIKDQNVFTLPNYPHFIFRKFASHASAEMYLENTINAERARLVYGLDRIAIPRTKLVYADHAAIVVQEIFVSYTTEEVQELKLNAETLRQMVTVIAKAKLHNISWETVSCLRDGRVAFIDTHLAYGAAGGIKGLANCVPQIWQAEIVHHEAARQGIIPI